MFPATWKILMKYLKGVVVLIKYFFMVLQVVYRCYTGGITGSFRCYTGGFTGSFRCYTGGLTGGVTGGFM